MSSTQNRWMGLTNGVLGILGVFRGLAVAAFAGVGLARLPGGGPVRQARLFFALALAEGLLVGLLAGGVLLAAGVLLLRGRRWGRTLAFGYMGLKLVFGLLTLAVVVLFFARVRGELAMIEAMRGLRHLTAFGWTVQTLALLGLVFGGILALMQLLLLRAEPEWASSDAPQYPPPMTTGVDVAPDRTQVYRGTSPTVSLHVYQNGRAKETKSFELFDQEGRARRFVIGRGAQCDLALSNDRAVSEEHCALRCDGSGRLCVTDLDSSNGTMLKRGVADPKRITARTPLQHGDFLLVGHRGASQVRVYFDEVVRRQTRFG